MNEQFPDLVVIEDRPIRAVSRQMCGMLLAEVTGVEVALFARPHAHAHRVTGESRDPAVPLGVRTLY
jgi:hypothetical protein